MGKYQIKKENITRTKVLLLAALCSWLLFWVLMYYNPDHPRSIFSLIPPQWQSASLVGILLLTALLFGVLYFKASSRVRVEKEFEIGDGCLTVLTQRGPRTEKVELTLKEITFIENDEDRIVFESPRGKFRFNPEEFASMEEYERFRMELICERCKE